MYHAKTEIIFIDLDEQGWRASQEDAHIAAVGLKQSDNSVIPDTALFAVFDGHGGTLMN